MSLVDEYRRQSAWRDWDRALLRCPILPGHTVLDLGCGPGDVSGLLSARGLNVTGVDADAELLAAARERYPACRFEQQDLRALTLPAGRFDGLWCSFTAAYLVDFEGVLSRWLPLLQPRAWICVTEMDDLLGHEPLSTATRKRIEKFYQDALAQRRYDFRAGRKLTPALRVSRFEVQQFELDDRELSFQGPALPEVLEAWRSRLARMGGLRAFLGDGFTEFVGEFLSCLGHQDHRSHCRVVSCVATRGTGAQQDP